MTNLRQRFVRAALIVLAPMLIAGCGINTIPTKDEKAKAAWAEVQNQYQRRADLIPNLVETVKGYATQEREVLTQVTEARASATQVKVDASTITDPAAFEKYAQAQDQLSGVLGRLMMIQERYPDLKSNQNFLALQSQLEGTENRITVASGRYIPLVQDYNTYLRQFPVNLTAMVFGHKTKPNFTVENEAQIQRAPAVEFGTAPAAPPPAQPAPAPAH